MNPEDKETEIAREKNIPAIIQPPPHTEPPPPQTIRISELQRLGVEPLVAFAKNLGLKNLGSLTKSQIVFETIKHLASLPDQILVGEGVLEILPDGFGFLRSPHYSYMPSAEDIYVSPTQIRRFDLKKGDTVFGTIRPPKESCKEKYFALCKVELVNSRPTEHLRERGLFENGTPIYPHKRLFLETASSKVSMRLLDLLAPMGKGQRALIIAPPRTGKTVLMQDLANAIATNHPEVVLLVLLIDERPEEVTEMARSVRGEVVASTFDESAERHIHVTEMVFEKAKRLVESGYDVVLLLDSITRLARAYNTMQPHSGKILTGGIDASSLQKPKKLFGSARQLENGGSLTIIGTGLDETGSRGDEVTLDEFKGTANSEAKLSKMLAEKLSYPALDPFKSGTRREELLRHPEEMEKVLLMRRALAECNSAQDAWNLAMNRLKKTKSNAELLLSLSK